MSIPAKYPKRLIEVDLPIKRISLHAQREKSIRQGHISTLHIWWARRPLAACRAVLCASLWPDPADPHCSEGFVKVVKELMVQWTLQHQNLLSKESWSHFAKYSKNIELFNNPINLRVALLDFIADFANWDNAANPHYLEISRKLTESSRLNNESNAGVKPLVIDPFAGGGAIPLETLRVGADVFASDLNPVACLLNKVVLEIIPKYRYRLLEELEKCGDLIKENTVKELNNFYPNDDHNQIPIAYLWARIIRCEGPGCGIEIPLIKSPWLLKKKKNYYSIKLVIKDNKIEFEILNKAPADINGTVKRGSALCPKCGFTTSVESVRKQLTKKNGGADDARLFAVVVSSEKGKGKGYRLPNDKDIAAFDRAKKYLKKQINNSSDPLLPNEEIPLMSGVFNVPIYGHKTWSSLFNSRQALTISTLIKNVKSIDNHIKGDKEFITAIKICLALAVDRVIDKCASLVVWDNTRDMPTHVFGRQALGMVWDYAESNPLCNSTGSWSNALNWVIEVCKANSNANYSAGKVEIMSATNHSLPNKSVDAIITDPPYYNAVPYADLSDFFYVWLRRMLKDSMPDYFSNPLSPKKDEICEMSGWDNVRYPNKDKDFFEDMMCAALTEGNRLIQPDGIAVIVFAHKSTAGWEAMLNSVIKSGWIITGSWPIDTEMANRLRAQNSAALTSSIHLVCRPMNKDSKEIGDWRDILEELPRRIHDWMPRLVKEGVVGADAIFACLGPALEIFSRYEKVEKSNGDIVELHEFLEYVWAAVAKEALNTIFDGADTSEFEGDARLTVMWLWTLFASKSTAETEDSSYTKLKGFSLDSDTARKIYQGLGIHVDKYKSILVVKGEETRLLSVDEREKYLFGIDANIVEVETKKISAQQSLFNPETTENIISQENKGNSEIKQINYNTLLDKVHAAMLLFNSGNGQLLKKFIIEDGIGKEDRFWKLAQSLSALYPSGTNEKRWVDGLLAKKKSFGY